MICELASSPPWMGRLPSKTAKESMQQVNKPIPFSLADYNHTWSCFYNFCWPISCCWQHSSNTKVIGHDHMAWRRSKKGTNTKKTQTQKRYNPKRGTHPRKVKPKNGCRLAISAGLQPKVTEWLGLTCLVRAWLHGMVVQKCCRHNTVKWRFIIHPECPSRGAPAL